MSVCPTAQPETMLQELTRLVGAEHANDAPRLLAHWSRTTLPEGTRPLLVVRPGNTSEVQGVVAWAARHEMPVYPISRGRNWGYGDACPPRSGCILLDLGRMNRILEINVPLCYAVVEPGVTQAQLYEHLEEHRLPLWMDATGAGPDTSIVGNVLERGLGLSPYSDRFAHSCALEAVLPDGRLLHTGFGAYPGARAEHLYRDGCGPALDGLFTQSNFGIVTRLTFWLLPRPKEFCAFFLQVRDRDGIGPLVEALRPLRLNGTLRSSVHFFNDLRQLGGVCRFPWDIAHGRQALEVQHPEYVSGLLKQHGISAWLATGSLSGSPEEVAAGQNVLRRALRNLPGVRAYFIQRRRHTWLRRLLAGLRAWRLLPRFCDRLDRVLMWVEFLQGKPSYGTLTGAHWRARGQAGPDQDPRDSGAGLIWVCPVLPMTAGDVAEVTRRIETCVHHHGFEFQVTLSQVSDRALCAVTSIHFDRSNPEETSRAGACHDALLHDLLDNGYVPYRAAPRALPILHDVAPAHWYVTRKLKTALDPLAVLAPGRYQPEADGSRAGT